MDLSVIIVSWNVREKLRENLNSIFKSKGDYTFEVFVVDNASGDGTSDIVKKEFPQVKLIANDKNFGFGRANNQGIKYAVGRYILLLNPDMKVFDDTFDMMIAWMDNHKNVGVGGCRLISEAGETVRQVRRFPRVSDQLAIILKLPHIFPRILGRYLRSDFDYENESEADSIRGAFFMIRKEVIEKIGGMDERYFLWFEEVDYCRRVKNAGWKIMYTPDVEAVDEVGQSFKQIKRGAAQKYFRDSMLKYFKKWEPTWQYWVLKIAWPIGIVIAVAGELLQVKNKAKT